MSDLPYIDDPIVLREELRSLRTSRKDNQIGGKRKYALSRKARMTIHQKTDGRCHICGIDVAVDAFQADHVKSHSSGGRNDIQNFLPTCTTCNNYRWHYSPQEIQWILKMGIWVKTKIEKWEKIGKILAEAFIKYEIKREERRKHPREPKR